MEQKQKLHLTGYFDSNFGDDMMMKLVAHSLPEITFVVADTVETPILSRSNVLAQSREACAQLPKLVVTGSGFMINSKDALKTELIWFLKGRNPGEYCLGCNMEPLTDPVKRFLIRSKLNKFKLITCRDQASYRWLKKNTRKPEVHCLPDIVFSMPEDWIPKTAAPDKLGISMMHRAGDSPDCAYYRAMAQLADRWIRETGKGVILMAFDTGKEDDLFACRGVQALMEHPERTEIAAHKTGTEIPEAFARCEKIIGARFHAIVLALRMGVSLYPLIFREKARNLLKDIGFPFASCDLDALDMDALESFLAAPPQAWALDPAIHRQAKEHARLLKERYERMCHNEQNERRGSHPL